jgi:hypothetical protein
MPRNGDTMYRISSGQRSERDSTTIVIRIDYEQAGSFAAPVCCPSQSVKVVMTQKESQDVEKVFRRNGENGE